MRTVAKCDNFDLDGRVALVTGAASGIGAGIAEVLAEAGAKVVLADIDESKAEQQAQTLSAAGLAATAVRIDLTCEASVVGGCELVRERDGAPWVLVNNAGLQDRQLLLEGTADFWDRTMAVNARGAFLMTREVARAMVAAGSGGRIVNVASAALIGSLTKGLAAYASSKAALEGLMRASALDLVEHGITVNTVLPGGVLTPGALGAKGPAPVGPALRPPPLGMCEPRDIGAAVLFFASLAAGRVTNQSLAVDAGWSIT
jgi:NAD(P)-dependent dehydrogenase (short-subunit alcohol dehydrogenase family)